MAVGRDGCDRIGTPYGHRRRWIPSAIKTSAPPTQRSIASKISLHCLVKPCGVNSTQLDHHRQALFLVQPCSRLYGPKGPPMPPSAVQRPPPPTRAWVASLRFYWHPPGEPACLLGLYLFIASAPRQYSCACAYLCEMRGTFWLSGGVLLSAGSYSIRRLNFLRRLVWRLTKPSAALHSPQHCSPTVPNPFPRSTHSPTCSSNRQRAHLSRVHTTQHSHVKAEQAPSPTQRRGIQGRTREPYRSAPASRTFVAGSLLASSFRAVSRPVIAPPTSPATKAIDQTLGSIGSCGRGIRPLADR
ncbi:hypothetical protein BIW11_04641 [Tropilaelaps mercedesae]|uniref:Uncharacterized protein n=1 Tax=Tropilaelaps mercedesae TaxID=418985 RepID=A0A1V9X3R4_9ACAR|nr:hypothetical protein BIW11_04641 [Tropilaelaps mercedesae]